MPGQQEVTVEEGERRPLIPRVGSARRPSHQTTSYASSHAKFYKAASRSMLGASINADTIEQGSTVTHEKWGVGTVAEVIECQPETKALVGFEDGQCRLFKLSALTLMSLGESLRRGGTDEGEMEAEEEDGWKPYEYTPGTTPLTTTIAMVVLGELEERKMSNGEYEYKRAWNYLNALLVFVPLCFAANYGTSSQAFIFVCCFFAIIPLAGLLGHFTEDLACHVGSALGALLNASFGNATEIIISVFAVKKRLFPVIKNSMLGSVMGNMLLVLGCAFLSRSIPNGTEQRKKELARSALWEFNAQAANVFASLLFLSSVALTIPTAYAQLHVRMNQDPSAGLPGVPPPQGSIYDVSRATAIAMIVCYCAFLLFQVKHNDVFAGGNNGAEGEGAAEEEEEEAPKMSKAVDIGGLALVTVLIAFVSEFLVGSLEEAAAAMGLKEAWVAVILLPIIGNAAEHATAIVSAYKGDMEIAIGVAVGSSIQIAGFAVPVLVIVSWMVNGSDDTLGETPVKYCGDQPCPGALDMNFHPFSMICMVLSVIVVNTIVTDGKGSWLEGLALLTTYVVVAIAFWYVPSKSDA
eukprot:TRINITY_DN6259_c0_g1_i1.p1 TRINITY_DN6259_c0_g1~~TRINITY_DN6259_c0_g1_i1.p1  ORF type:complete len:607 (+),score=259.42 TRINITY_DN6259_c0_g1_i1:85-1821(+)